MTIARVPLMTSQMELLQGVGAEVAVGVGDDQHLLRRRLLRGECRGVGRARTGDVTRGAPDVTV